VNLFDKAKLETEVELLEQETMSEGFWNDSSKAQETVQKMNTLKEKLDDYREIESLREDSKVILDLSESYDDESYINELKENIKKLEKQLYDFKLKTLLSGEYDANNAIMAIHAGAGGLEAQDWAEMLLRMYKRWAESKNYRVDIIDYIRDTEGGVKSVTMLIKGINAYGYLKSEKGVHRLVRMSPFDSSGKRHTSFASVDISPEVGEDVDIEINPADLKIDTYRASGAGGQHVNTTDSAIRITHLPTGVVVQCQNERSQHSNKATAMRMLISKLVDIKEAEHKEKIEDLQGNYNQIGWGSQIRSYVFHPYSMVKDHRTNAETGNIDSVMDGNIDKFINEYLSYKAKEKESL
jgi:peptide chain release factor 2